ncbi:phosphopantetheine-binding protein [Streptomyces sp. P9(2023)]|uniref:phosphopantetheine-binding protein n=1 Tax=Streptomyces sp. P9(2023) TaxID=3064394 RepID=UPI0028F3EDBB|nr:phosphopantetheine-binding protein [Streptomyces sp. P9(2023)]MDT9691507.1 phosphopantetheine-binding protein [Streptomyces sp. P9(2023)]
MDPASHPNPLEKATARIVAEIWCEVLEIPEVGDDDNFFDLGGHSILLQMVRDRIATRTGKDVALLDLFNHPTVRSLARHLDGAEGTGAGEGRRRTVGRLNGLGNRRARLGTHRSDTGGESSE